MDHRVKYNKAPLVETIFQIQFPEILKISAEQPAAFQEKIRDKYPLFNQKIINGTITPLGLPVESLPSIKNYEFLNSAGNTKVVLTNTFVAVSTLAYTQWEDFKKNCIEIVNITNDVYKLNVIQRIGLRYKDLIVRSKWALKERPWKELIKAEYLGALSEEDENLISHYVLDYEIKNPADDVYAHNHRELVQERQTLEKSLLIDNDYYRLGIFKAEDVDSISDKLHENASLFIQNVFTNQLEQAMEPLEL